MKQEPGRQQPGIPIVYGGEDVNMRYPETPNHMQQAYRTVLANEEGAAS